MSDLNKIKNEVSSATKKVLGDLKLLSRKYKEFQAEIDARFREELREQHGKMDGLEDFYGLNLYVKRNSQNVNNAFGMLTRLTDVSTFNISEINDLEDKRIRDLVS
jgi:hypothetical protein